MEELTSLIEQIINDKFAVISNQHGDFKVRSDLKTDNQIDKELKNVLTILSEYCREYLLKYSIHRRL